MSDVEIIRAEAPDGVRTEIRMTGPADGPPVILVHGILHTNTVWKYQIADPALSGLRLIAHDVRGHGVADKPEDRAYYDAERFADEIRTVIEASGAECPILLGWSLGGRLIFNYLRKYGWSDLAGYAIVGARPSFDPETATSSGHNALLLACADDLSQRIAARRDFVLNCHHVRPTENDLIDLLGCAMMTPPQALRNFIGHPLDEEDILQALDIPVHVFHGARDAVCPLSAVTHLPELNPGLEMTTYNAVGHSPFFEAPVNFNQDLLKFVQRCRG